MRFLVRRHVRQRPPGSAGDQWRFGFRERTELSAAEVAEVLAELTDVHAVAGNAQVLRLGDRWPHALVKMMENGFGDQLRCFAVRENDRHAQARRGDNRR
jgi:hypothetical protein